MPWKPFSDLSEAEKNRHSKFAKKTNEARDESEKARKANTAEQLTKDQQPSTSTSEFPSSAAAKGKKNSM